MKSFESLHQEAVRLSSELRTVESSLIDLLLPIERSRGYLGLGYSSLFQYCLGALNLSESQAYAFIAIARKSETVPELREAVVSEQITVSNARRIAAVLTPENKSEWLGKARELSQKQLEREIVKVRPELAVRDSIRPICDGRLELKMGIDYDLEKELARVREIIMNERRGPVTQAEVLKAMVTFYLNAKDPVRRADRLKDKTTSRRVGALKAVPAPGKACSTRVLARQIPAAVKHQVHSRDGGQCQFQSHEGKRCNERVWVETHHLRPWSQGGGHSIENLLTLCRSHHQYLHESESGQAELAV